MTVTLGALVGCVAAPKATVELAEVVDQQIAQLQGSHEQFVRLYYRQLRERVETLMADRWTPVFLGHAFDDPQFKKEFERALVTARIDPDKIELAYRDTTLSDPDKDKLMVAVRGTLATMKGELGEVMVGFADAARVQIQKQRRALLDPIDEQEGIVLDALRVSFADLQRGTAAIKAYLGSVVNLTESRDAILHKVGLLDTQRQVVEIAAKASEAAATAVAQGEKIEDVAGRLEALTEDVKKRVHALR